MIVSLDCDHIIEVFVYIGPYFACDSTSNVFVACDFVSSGFYDSRAALIMLQNLPIMLCCSAQGFCLLCSETALLCSRIMNICAFYPLCMELAAATI